MNMTNYKSKFDKKRCKKCKWHGKMAYGTTSPVYCNYTATAPEGYGCLRIIQGEKIDMRGTDYSNCLLYEKEQL